VEYIVVAKPFKHQLGLVSSLLTLSWEVNDDALITKSPLYLRDGDLMLWRDLRDVPKEVGSMPQVRGAISFARYQSLMKKTKSKIAHAQPTQGNWNSHTDSA